MINNDTKKRLLDIEARIDELKNEKIALELSAKWTPEAIASRIKAEVERVYGIGKVKLALLKVNSEYNDEGYDHSPHLILVDANYDDIQHSIDPDMFMPTDREESDYYDAYYESINLTDIKVKF